MFTDSLETILDAAGYATRTAMRGGHWWPEDWEDAGQEAVVGILQAARGKGDAEYGYYFRAGLHQIYKWMRDVRLKGRDRLFQLDDYATTLITEGRLTAEDTTISRAMLTYLDALPERLRKPLRRSRRLVRSQGVGKPIQIERQIEYLRLRLEGYSTDGVALELHCTVDSVYRIRKRLLPRLRAIEASKQSKAHE